MKAKEQLEFLKLLDLERQWIIYPSVTRFSDMGVVRDVSLDGRSCEIVYSSCSRDEVDQVIKHQVQTARSAGHELEWKVYGHDQPECLGKRLVAAGFEAGEMEAFMIFLANKESLGCFGTVHGDIRRVTSNEGLADYRIVREEVYGSSCVKEIERYASVLEDHPINMSVYVVHVDEEPAACGRIHFHESSRFAGLCGGSTRERFRNNGLYTQMVAVRIREALSRGIVNVVVDALPTSEPILRKRGFESLTYTQPFRLQ